MNAQESTRGSVALITGAGRGIGREIALCLAQEGMSLVLGARTEKELQNVCDECATMNVRAIPVRTDVTVEEDVKRMVRTALDQFGRVDVMVNNAGIGFFRTVEEMRVDEFDAMWNVNVRGAFLFCREVIPAMRKQGGGVIVNIGSLAGKNGVRGGAGYAATKWALRGFAASLMPEVRDDNVRVVTIFPGSVDTSFSDRNRRGSRITQPEDVADAVLFAATMPARAMVSEIDIRPTRP